MRQWRLAAAWVLAAAVATTLAWQIVSLADDRVGEAASAPINVSGPSPTTSTTVVGATTTSAETPSTSPTTSKPANSTSSLPPTTTPGGELMTIPTVGGTVTVRVIPGSISYVSAVPAPGFVVEVEDPGPPDVRVEFVSVSTEVEVRVRWRDGRVEVRVD